MTKSRRLKQYDVVRIVEFYEPIENFEADSALNQRAPRVGDVATIVEVYVDPPGYELECCAASDGITTWLHAFPPHAIELEVLGASE